MLGRVVAGTPKCLKQTPFPDRLLYAIFTAFELRLTGWARRG